MSNGKFARCLVYTFISVAVSLSSAVLASENSSNLGGQPAESSCRQAERWVSENSERLPAEYQDFIQLPEAYRKAVYRQLEPEQRKGLWETQWNAALNREDLSDLQRDVLLESMQFALDDLFAASKVRNGWRYEQAMVAVKDFEGRAVKAFGREEARRLFAQLGPVRGQRVLVTDGKNDDLPQNFSEAFVGGGEACSCSRSSDYCPNGYGCAVDGDGCNVIEDECGTFWTYDCNGECLAAQ